MDSEHTINFTVDQPLDLAVTLDGGQAFRWRLRDGWRYGVLQDTPVALRQDGPRVEMRTSSTSPERMEAALRDYLRLDDDLEDIYSLIDTDARMHEAIAAYRGLRILRQDPWECLVAFICSANSNIPRISNNMMDIAKNFGEPLELDGYVCHSFPPPQRLAQAGEAALRDLKLGFRANYVAQAAERVALGELELGPLRTAPYQEAKDALTSLPGVGDKVADCVLLFSLDKLDACPIDRWIRRALEDWYLDGLKLNYKNLRAWSLEKWGAYGGYAQQYLFQLIRLSGKAPSEDRA